MKKTSKTVVFFGNERLATGVTTTAPTLQALVAADYHVAAVVTNHTVAQSRRLRTLEIETVAQQHNIPVIIPKKMSDIRAQLADLNAVVGILVAFGKIVPSWVIDLFPSGIINIHPSLLPKHRGPTPLESVLLQGETETGVSLMQLAPAMDAGPVFRQQKVPIPNNTTKQELADLLIKIGSDMLLDSLPAILAGRLAPHSQNEALATYDQLIQKANGMIDWTKPAERLEREIRAFAGWPGSHTTLGAVEVIVTAAHALPGDGASGNIEITTVQTTKSLSIYCGRGKLSITRLKPSGKPEMDVVSFLNGYSERIITQQ